jgi:hypothetical protein
MQPISSSTATSSTTAGTATHIQLDVAARVLLERMLWEGARQRLMLLSPGMAWWLCAQRLIVQNIYIHATS